MAVLPALSMMAAICMLPESPRWLLRQKREEEAEAALALVTSEVGEPFKEEMEALRQVVNEDHLQANQTIFGALCTLWSEVPLRRAGLLGILVMTLNQRAGQALTLLPPV